MILTNVDIKNHVEALVDAYIAQSKKKPTREERAFISMGSELVINFLQNINTIADNYAPNSM